MKEFKGTPGPWITTKSQSGKNNINIIGTALGGKYKIARIPFMCENPENDVYQERLNELLYLEAEADANLIASSPILLKALQDIETMCKNGISVAGIKDVASLAIAKALGEVAK